jgi:membrane protein
MRIVEKTGDEITERESDTAGEVPARFSGDWWRRVAIMFVQAGRDLVYDNGMSWAAAIAYYALLSLVPLVLAGALIATLVVDADTAVSAAVDIVEGLIPMGEEEIEEIVREAMNARGVASIFSILGLLWTGTRVFGQLIMALNVAFDVDAPYGLMKRFMAEMIMLMSVGMIFLLSLLTGTGYGMLADVFEIVPAGEGALFFIVTEVLPFLLLVLAFFLLYRIAPRTRVHTMAALAGTATAAVLFVAARSLFLTYILDFANYNVIYGSLAILITLVFWTWVAAIVILYGGEVASHTQMMLVEGMSADEVEERHRERSQGQSGWRTERSRVEEWLMRVGK